MAASARPALLPTLCLPLLLAPGLATAQLTGDAAAGVVTPRGGEPAVQHIVTEDEGVRIEELRVRGQVQRIVVQSKLGQARPYEILPATQARDLSQDKRAAGQRVWSVLSF
ncbi:MAG: hypothetical protein IT500_16485 [Rubrivivax sp.]|nr:hypothetical protein [Rubrivivax sp.]